MTLSRRHDLLRTLALIGLLVAAGCTGNRSNPKLATRPFPTELHTTDIVDMQVFRDGTNIEVVNTTARSYVDFDLWLNKRYVRRVESLPAGKSIHLDLWSFYDEFGEAFNAGGFFRRYEATPLRLVQIQPDPTSKMIGLVTIRAEEIE